MDIDLLGHALKPDHVFLREEVTHSSSDEIAIHIYNKTVAQFTTLRGFAATVSLGWV